VYLQDENVTVKEYSTVLFLTLNETLIGFLKHFVPPSVIDLVAPFDKGIPFCRQLKPSNK